MANSSLPPVSFILTGYNQAHLIDDAIDGALAQDYPSLQIVLTDDRSDDETFAIMRTRAEAYRGPHQIVTTQPSENRGTFGNIHHAFGHATGELIVFAGGDDVSYPNRTRAIIDCWLDSGASALYSRYDVIDEDGHLLERDWKPDAEDLWLLDYFPEQEVEPLHGASMACHRSVLEDYPADGVRIRSEDAYLTLMLALDRKKVAYIDRSLVRYRKHPGAITNETPPPPTMAGVAARERGQMRFSESQKALLELFSERLHERGGAKGIDHILKDDLELFALRSCWDRSTLRDRVAALPAARRRGHLDWLLPRAIGFRTFVAIKALALKARN